MKGDTVTPYAPTVAEMREAERDAAAEAFKRATGQTIEWGLSSDRGWLEGYVFARAERAEVVQCEPTEEMATAYLKANNEYWRETDALPTQNPSTWRNGTPSEACKAGLRAVFALMAERAEAAQPSPLPEKAPPPALQVKPRRPLDDDEPWGYLESDKDYVLNNIELAVALLDAAQAKGGIKS